MKYSNKFLIEVLVLFIIATLAAAFFFVAQVFVVDGDSMYPNLKTGERIVIDKRAYVNVSPVKGDVVGLKDPNEPRLSYIKRVVAHHGDRVLVKGNDVLVNGVPLYKVSGYQENRQIEIPRGMYFVMGDNRRISYDSREFGLVPGSNIIGKAVAVVWPLGKIRAIK